MDYSMLNRAADNIRVLSVAMVEKAGSGHPGGAMGGADFIGMLYLEFLNFDPDDLSWPFRDRFFLDPGHMSPMLYSVLSLFGIYSMDDLKAFRQWKSCTPGHPELDIAHGVENTSGPLGQGHVMAVGAAIAERFLTYRFGDWMSHKIYTYVSDGGVQEEISQGAGRIAGHLGLNNLVMFFDANEVQLSTMVDEVTSEDTAAKYRAWGWRTITINGNDPSEISDAFKQASSENKKPVLIIGNTIMGKGCVTETGESFESKVSTHGQPISKAGASPEKTIAGLGGDPADPFTVFPDVADYVEGIRQRKREQIAGKRAAYEQWQRENPGQDLLLRSILSGEIPNIDYSSIPLKPATATRSASGAVLAAFAGVVPNMIVISADLSNSDKTDGFLSRSKPLTRDDFNGGFLHAGVSELTMAALANGMALHNIIPVCGTFFVFSDYMKPAVRLSALMELPVKFVWTHDSFRVGEDGPTHQPVEHEAQIRLMEKLQNHSGRNSVMVLRPADAAETVAAWKIAMENKDTPTALILSRQNIPDLPATSAAGRYQEALQSEMGAYTIIRAKGNPDIILAASGSEVATLVEVADLLEKNDKITAGVVSVPSEGIFRNQEAEYRQEIFPKGVPVIALTAGLPETMAQIAGSNGFVIGMNHFGYSAPFQELDRQFGFTPQYIASTVLQIIGKFKEEK